MDKEEVGETHYTMKIIKFALKGLRFYWRAHLGVLLELRNGRFD